MPLNTGFSVAPVELAPLSRLAMPPREFAGPSRKDQKKRHEMAMEDAKAQRAIYNFLTGAGGGDQSADGVVFNIGDRKQREGEMSFDENGNLQIDPTKGPLLPSPNEERAKMLGGGGSGNEGWAESVNVSSHGLGDIRASLSATKDPLHNLRVSAMRTQGELSALQLQMAQEQANAKKRQLHGMSLIANELNASGGINQDLLTRISKIATAYDVPYSHIQPLAERVKQTMDIEGTNEFLNRLGKLPADLRSGFTINGSLTPIQWESLGLAEETARQRQRNEEEAKAYRDQAFKMELENTRQAGLTVRANTLSDTKERIAALMAGNVERKYANDSRLARYRAMATELRTKHALEQTPESQVEADYDNLERRVFGSGDGSGGAPQPVRRFNPSTGRFE